MTIAQHLSKTNEHYTPANVVEAAREWMGSIDLDPASCAEANETVKARVYCTKERDGLTMPWFGNVFNNPPGGRLKWNGEKWVPVTGGKAESSMRIWWQYLANQYASFNVDQAVFLAFTLEILRTSQQGTPVQAFFRCYPKERLCFGGDDPTHANVIAGLPPRTQTLRDSFANFKRCFSAIGFCEPCGDRDFA